MLDAGEPVLVGIALGSVCGLLAAFLLFLGSISPPVVPTAIPERFPPTFLKGISYESWWNGEFNTPESDKTLTEIIQPLGANWIALIVKCNQTSLSVTTIDCNTKDITVSDEELAHAMKTAHQAGLKVMLKPHINLVDPNDATVGRHEINHGTDETKWQTWFDNYTQMITHYATLAEQNGAEYFVIGTELSATTGREADCYQAFFDVFEDKPWLQGIFWWSYSTKPDQGGLNDRSYTPHNKPAENILRLYYGQANDTNCILCRFSR